MIVFCCRVLELLQLLDRQWSNTKLGLSVYPLIFLNYNAGSVIESAQTMIEYMGEQLLKSFGTSRDTPFHLRSVRLAKSVAEIEAIQGPKVCVLGEGRTTRPVSRVVAALWDHSLALRALFHPPPNLSTLYGVTALTKQVVLVGMQGLSAGFGLELFLSWCGAPHNLVLFTGRPPVGTLGRKLIDNPGLQKIEITRRRKVPLEGAEVCTRPSLPANRL